MNYIPIPNRIILSVSQLNRESSQLLGDHFLSVYVAGEISNLSTPASGHIYFSLKDANAQVRCAMFKSQQQRLTIKPENGNQVIVKAHVALYEPRGDFQLIIEHIEVAGDGVLQKAFEAMKRKLLAEGLFDIQHKQKLPELPKTIGVITSPTGAAIRDILTVLKRRFSAVAVIIYPVQVQGENAKNQIADAIDTANRLQQTDLLILARGGGSLEDLWAFNEEMVARAIFASKIPIISAVGHETDVTISDFVADFRAATPSAAAESATPDQQHWLSLFIQFESRLTQLVKRKINQVQQSLDWLNRNLQQQHPGQKMSRNRQHIGQLESRLHLTIQTKLSQQNSVIQTKSALLWQFNPGIKIDNLKQRQFYLEKQLLSITKHRLEKFKHRLLNGSQTLNAVSPLATLNRGYALAVLQPSGEIIRSSDQLSIGDKTETKIASGNFTSVVTAINAE